MDETSETGSRGCIRCERSTVSASSHASKTRERATVRPSDVHQVNSTDDDDWGKPPFWWLGC